ncbi:MAG: hypothetical protein FKY71_10390 [Spiribacter salinus]|uniref:Uncharacterized protein n=1 Tax=Spiribacter salinus TaxID=1335746 RepID=A0A540VQR1_9GAMM|nr:MAG: hypothetical protein FKY71_10390 [Spiribacter salinus]
MSERALVSEVEEVTAQYEETTGKPATRTRQMIERHGHIQALSRLMVSADLQQGFRALRDAGQLDQTFEALVVRYSALFSAEVVAAAQWRLDSSDKLL